MLKSLFKSQNFYNNRPKRTLYSSNDRNMITKIRLKNKQKEEAEKQFKIKPEYKNMLEKTEKLCMEMNTALLKNKSSITNQFLLKSKNIYENMDNLNKKIDLSKNEIIKHDCCFIESLKDNILLNEEHKIKQCQNKYYKDESFFANDYVTNINKEIIMYKQSKIKAELLTQQIKSQINFINKDIDNLQDKILHLKNHNYNIQKTLSQYKIKIYNLTKQNNIKEIYMRNLKPSI